MTFRYLYALLKGKTYQHAKLPAYRNWSDEQKKIFREYCGPYMEELGYAYPS